MAAQFDTAKAARFSKWQREQEQRKLRAERRGARNAAGIPWVATEAQAEWASRKLPNMDMRDAVQVGFAWANRRREQEFEAEMDAAELAEAVAEADKRLWSVRYRTLANGRVRKVWTQASAWQDGYLDVEWDEWHGSETQGVPVEGFDNRIVLSRETFVSPRRVLDGIDFLIFAQTPGLTFALRAWLTRHAKLQFDHALYAAPGTRDYVVTGETDEAEADEVMGWVGRDPQDEILATNGAVIRGRSVVGRGASSVVSRWNRPDDELEYGELIREMGLEDQWVELLTAFRRRKLHKTLVAYFGMDKYQDESIVLKWAKTKRGGWRPVEQLGVTQWIERSVAYAGSQLGGYQSCTLSLIEKAARKGKRVAVKIDRAEMDSILKVGLHDLGIEIRGFNDCEDEDEFSHMDGRPEQDDEFCWSDEIEEEVNA